MGELNNSEIVASVVTKKKKTGLIIGTAAAVLTGSAVLSYAAVPAVKNAVNMTFMSPEKYCASVYKDASDKFAVIAATEMNTEHNAAKMSLTLDFDDNIMDVMREQFQSDLFRSLTFSADTFASGENEKAEISVKADDRNVISAEALKCGDTAYIKIPGLSDKYLSYDISEALSSYDISAQGRIPSGDEVSEIIKRYSSIITECISDSENKIEKGFTDSVEGIEYKYAKITTVIKASELKEMLEKLADTLENDSVLREIYEGNSKENSSFDGLTDRIRIQADLISEDDPAHEIVTFVDANGHIRGIMSGEEDVSTGFIMARDNSYYALKINMPDESVSVKAEDTDGAFTGAVNFSYDDSDFIINFENLKIIDKKFISGNISADISEFTDDESGVLSLAFEKEEDIQRIYTEVENAGKVTFEYRTYFSDVSDVTSPSDELVTDNANAFISESDTEKLLTGIFNSLGINEEYIQSLVDMMISGSVFKGAEFSGMSDYTGKIGDTYESDELDAMLEEAMSGSELDAMLEEAMSGSELDAMLEEKMMEKTIVNNK